MVLEHLFPERWLEKKWFYAFMLGVFYSVIGIMLARLLFPTDPALVSVAFISLLMLPELYKLFSIAERREKSAKRSFRYVLKENAGFIKSYMGLFLGILLVYSLATVFLPSFQSNTLFREQLAMRDTTGQAIADQRVPTASTPGYFDMAFFVSILINNAGVIIACFLISFLTGDGGIFLITWNASVWGTIFGMTARNAALYSNTVPILVLAFVILVVLPHVILEGGAYILGAISGGVISKDVLLEKVDSKRFNRVFFYNLRLFLIGLVVLVVGAVVETVVIGNVPLYAQIIVQSMG